MGNETLFWKLCNKLCSNRNLFVADEMHSLHRQIPHLIWFVDGTNRGAVNECKAKFGEHMDWEKPKDVNPEYNYIIPVSFGRA